MPAPIVPAPMTPALATGNAAARSAPDPRSAKNRCRSARDSLDRRHSSNNSRARPSACVEGPRRRRLQGIDDASAAPACAALPTAWQPAIPRRAAGVASRRRQIAHAPRRRAGRRRVRAPRQLRQPAHRRRSGDRSVPCAVAASRSIGLPPVISSSDAFQPTTRGSRTVPPAPGSRPSVTSGNPSLRSAVAAR